MSRIGDAPAFPGEYDLGMTYRQWLAGLAMQGYIIKGLEGSTAHAFVAADAVRSADALIAELETQA